MIWQVGGGLAGMDGVSRIAGIAGWDGGAKHFYGFFSLPEGTFEHYQHFYIAEHAIMKNTLPSLQVMPCHFPVQASAELQFLARMPCENSCCRTKNRGIL